MSIDALSEVASLQQLQRTPIDAVLQSIDEGLVHLPSYRDLYYRWERQHWQARDIDFSHDIMQWNHMTEDEQDNFISVMASFFQGEASVTDALAPYVIAMPDEEMRFFVTTQLVDESRHTIFFDRFFREVLRVEEGKIEDRLLMTQQYMNASMRVILVDALADMAQRLRCEPENRALLIEGVTLYHVIAEGTLALAGQRYLLEYFRKKNLFPGFRGGFTAVARDESRHVLFGVKFLRDMLQEDASYKDVVLDAIQLYAPVALDALAPVESSIPDALARHEDPWQTQRYGFSSLTKKLKVIGLNVELPAVPPLPTF
ncbi:MAG TPA: ribonucleotide-diphosphate reductase subunit beta [Ktedonosporobacter sp.]|jgi:ribonucleoside-diphosphate reductase beta chain|nr:ribonucleotide-diphosphate reductase subunit beta [Ktedonosporobacter sp.]